MISSRTIALTAAMSGRTLSVTPRSTLILPGLDSGTLTPNGPARQAPSFYSMRRSGGIVIATSPQGDVAIQGNGRRPTITGLLGRFASRSDGRLLL
jgi:hypothetical protein